jgi:hypothetical protein
MEAGSSHLHLEIEVESDPISGAVSVEGGLPQRFSGWIELVSAIEGARVASGSDVTLGWLPGANLADGGYLAAHMVPGHLGRRGAGPI